MVTLDEYVPLLNGDAGCNTARGVYANAVEFVNSELKMIGGQT